MQIIRRIAVMVTVILTMSAIAVTPARAEPTWNVSGPYYIVNTHNGLCLDAHANGGGVNGNRVGLWVCNYGFTEQWYLETKLDRGDWQHRLRNRKSGRCLDYPATSGGANGFQYILWDCVQSSGQWFRISDPRPEEGRSLLLSVLLGGPHNHVDAFANGGGGNGNPVGNWAWTGHPLQHWRFE